MAQTDWYNTNENIQYPFCPYEDSSELARNEILDCQFFIKNAPSALDPNNGVWLASKNLTNNNVTYTFKCSDTTDNQFKPLEFKFKRSDEWQCQWVKNDDWYGFVTIGKTK